MKSLSKALILAATVSLGLLSAGATWAHDGCFSNSYPDRYHDRWADTRIERAYDLNHDGYISRRERYLMNHRYVNTWWEARHDFNHNGVIDPREVAYFY